ncbi:MAG: SGNH/GDSL hydrolase family protein [Actinobacteria bacterium]|nr:SGNH/GDSL hydrolase family protein [Actinomycetota bacterium]
MACGLLLAAAASATPTTSGFAIAEGRVATNDRHVAVGDGGDSPFFARGVLVWEGGSIIAGAGATDGIELTAQTFALMDHTCRSFKSTSSSRTVTDMIAEAPLCVDVHGDPDADAAVCIVMAGGGDLGAGGDPQTVYDGLLTYCAARRAAGFKVVVLTLLPRSDREGFNAARATYNAAIREHWAGFADGLADVAADPRIGADGANLDALYYADGTHPTTAGYGVMAAAVAPVLESIGWHSDACRVRLANARAPWTAWHGYAESVSWLLPKGDGPKCVTARYRDGAGHVVTVSDDVMLDTTPPATRAAADVVVRRHATATLSYSVIDARPGSRTATVTIVIKRSSGTTALTLACGTRTVNARHSVKFRCALAKGTYRFFVKATDAAGNRQSRVGSALLTVR